MRSSPINLISAVSINIMPRNPDSFFYDTAHIASIRPVKRFRLPSLRRLAHHACTRSHYQSEIGRFVNLLLVFRSNYKRAIPCTLKIYNINRSCQEVFDTHSIFLWLVASTMIKIVSIKSWCQFPVMFWQIVSVQGPERCCHGDGGACVHRCHGKI